MFPAGRKNGNEWLVGSLNGEAGKSLSICINGSKVGVFKDFATDDGGDNLIELFMRARQIAFKDALHTCAEWLGVPVAANGGTARRSANDSRSHRDARLGIMPDAVSAAWKEGVEYALEHADAVDSLAEFRGWPTDFAHYIVGCAAVSMPRHKDKRGTAFLVVAPEGERGTMGTRDVGYHIRLKPDPGEKASWRFMPNEPQHGQSIPALPFVLGDFETANLLVIAEGQWDALTFALAAGWLGEDCLWPEGVGLIGIRGVSGINPFLQYYRRFWPVNANCLLLPDGDGPGSKWFNGADTFAERLAGLCRKVAVVRCGAAKDFNDAFRDQEITPGQITELLESHGMGLETAVLT